MNHSRVEYEKMLAGEPFLAPDPYPYMGALADAGRRRMKAFNDTPMDDFPARMRAAGELFGRRTNAAGNPCRIIRKQDERVIPVLPPFPEQG